MQTNVLLYDLPSGKLTRTAIKGKDLLARFDWTGQRLLLNDADRRLSLATVAELKPKLLAGRGTLTSICPAGTWEGF